MRPAVTMLLLVSAVAQAGGSRSAAQPLDNSVLTGPGLADQFQPAIAAFDGGYLAVWADGRHSHNSTDVYGLWIGAASGMGAVPLVVSEAPLAQLEPRVACQDALCVVVWLNERAGAGAEVRAARFNAWSTASLDARPLLVTPTPSPIGEPDVTIGASPSAAVVWNDDGTIMGQLVDLSTGLLSGAQRTVAAAPEWESSPRIAWDGSQWHVVWEAEAASGDEIRHVGFGSGAIPAPAVLGKGWRPALTWSPSGGTGFVSWLRTDGGSLLDIVGTRLVGATPAGLDAPPLELDNVGPYDDFGRGTAWNGTGFLSLWATSGNFPHTRVVDPASGSIGVLTVLSTARFGTSSDLACSSTGCGWMMESGNGLGHSTMPLNGMSSGAITRSSVPPPSQFAATAVWGSDSYVVAWIEASNNSTRLMARPVSPVGVPGSTAAAVEPGATLQAAPRLAARGTDIAVAWYDEGSGATTRVVQLNPQGRTIGTSVATGQIAVEAVTLVWVKPGRFLLAWSDGSAVRGTTAWLDAGVHLGAATSWFTEPSVSGIEGALAEETGVVYFTWWDGANGRVRFGRTDLDGIVQGSAATVPSQGTFATHPSVASDRRNALVAWSANGVGDAIYGARFDTVGPLGSVFRIDPCAETLSMPGNPSVVFDGVHYLVGYERAGDDAGSDLFVRVINTDGGFDELITLSATRAEDERPVLAAGTTGRVLMTYQLDEQLGVRVFVQTRSDVPEGAPCSAGDDCTQGRCVANVCNADAGTGGGAGGGGAGTAGGGATAGGAGGGGGGSGTAGGVAVERMYAVSCGCHTAPGELVVLLLALALRMRRR